LNRASVFLNKLQVSCRLGGLLVDQLDVFQAKLTAGLRDADLDQLSVINSELEVRRVGESGIGGVGAVA
jgi:hypothetical protein